MCLSLCVSCANVTIPRTLRRSTGDEPTSTIVDSERAKPTRPRYQSLESLSTVFPTVWHPRLPSGRKEKRCETRTLNGDHRRFCRVVTYVGRSLQYHLPTGEIKTRSKTRTISSHGSLIFPAEPLFLTVSHDLASNSSSSLPSKGFLEIRLPSSCHIASRLRPPLTCLCFGRGIESTVCTCCFCIVGERRHADILTVAAGLRWHLRTSHTEEL